MQPIAGAAMPLGQVDPPGRQRPLPRGQPVSPMAGPRFSPSNPAGVSGRKGGRTAPGRHPGPPRVRHGLRGFRGRQALADRALHRRRKFRQLVRPAHRSVPGAVEVGVRRRLEHLVRGDPPPCAHRALGIGPSGRPSESRGSQRPVCPDRAGRPRPRDPRQREEHPAGGESALTRAGWTGRTPRPETSVPVLASRPPPTPSPRASQWVCPAHVLRPGAGRDPSSPRVVGRQGRSRAARHSVRRATGPPGTGAPAPWIPITRAMSVHRFVFGPAESPPGPPIQRRSPPPERSLRQLAQLRAHQTPLRIRSRDRRGAARLAQARVQRLPDLELMLTSAHEEPGHPGSEPARLAASTQIRVCPRESSRLDARGTHRVYGTALFSGHGRRMPVQRILVP